MKSALDSELFITEKFDNSIPSELLTFFESMGKLDLIKNINALEVNLDEVKTLQADLILLHVNAKERYDDFCSLKFNLNDRNLKSKNESAWEAYEALKKIYIKALYKDRHQMLQMNQIAISLSSTFHQNRIELEGIIKELNVLKAKLLADQANTYSEDVFFKLANYIQKRENYLSRADKLIVKFDKALIKFNAFHEKKLNPTVEENTNALNIHSGECPALNSTEFNALIGVVNHYKGNLNKRKTMLMLAAPFIGASVISYLWVSQLLLGSFNSWINLTTLVNFMAIMSLLIFMRLTIKSMSNPFNLSSFAASIALFGCLVMNENIYSYFTLTTEAIIIGVLSIIVCMVGYKQLWSFDSDSETLEILNKKLPVVTNYAFQDHPIKAD